MRTATFEVPPDIFGDFTEKLTELELSNTITGRTEDGEIMVKVQYEKDESDQVDELEEHLADLIGETDEDDED